MANTLLTIAMITREAMRILHNNCVFARNADKQYDEMFAIRGAKIGTAINVRKPARYYVRNGQVMQVQDTTETYAQLVLSNQWGTDINFSSSELTLSLDDFSKRILTPAISRIASQIDFDGLTCYRDVFNQVGYPGTTPGAGVAVASIMNANSPGVYLNAGMLMDDQSTPRDNQRMAVMNPAAHAASVAGLSGLFNAQGALGEQYMKGLLGEALGFQFAMDQNVNTLTCGTRTHGLVTQTVQGANQVGSSVICAGLPANATVLRGEVVAFTGCNSINPENQQNTGNLAMFTVTANCTATAGGVITIPIYPAIKLPGATVADGTCAASPTNGGIVHFRSGEANTAYPQNLAYHQDAFTLGTADLEVPKGVDFSAREVYEGISMRIVRAYNINNDQFPCRIDVLGGWLTQRPELACRIIG